MAMTLEQFKEKFGELSFNQQIAIYNEYQLEHNNADDMLYDFDEEFFDMAFEGKNPMEVARATYFGKINWNDEYIRFNGYGNLESVSEFDAEEMIDE